MVGLFIPGRKVPDKFLDNFILKVNKKEIGAESLLAISGVACPTCTCRQKFQHTTLNWFFGTSHFIWPPF